MPLNPVGLGSSGFWKVSLQNILLVRYSCKERGEGRKWENVFEASLYCDSRYHLFLIV